MIPGLQNGILSIGGNTITDHNRAPLQVSYERIENRVRMVNGSLRTNFIANKLKISTSWDMVPSLGTKCVDNRTGSTVFGGNELRNLYETSQGNPVSVTITSRMPGSSTSVTKNMIFASFEYTVAKRSTSADGFDLVNMTVELEEV